MLVNRKYFHLIVFLFLSVSLLVSNSRIGFSRPGSYLRTPSKVVGNQFNDFFLGLSSEIINTNNVNYARSINFKATTPGSFDYGFNYLTHASNNQEDTDPPTVFLFHFTKEIYRYNNLIINLGVHDIPLSYDTNTPDPSLFLTFITRKIKLGENFFLQSATGFGAGKINRDSHNHNISENHANIFAGLNLTTPWRIKSVEEKINLIFEYIDNGFHFGLKMPITNNIQFQCGLTHIENIQNLNDYANDNNRTIFGDDAGIVIGFQYKIPNAKNDNIVDIEDLESVRISDPEDNCYIGLVDSDFYSPLQINNGCMQPSIKQIVQNVNTSLAALNDSLILLNESITAYDVTNQALEVKVLTLEDSIKITEIKNKISKNELNSAIKSFTNSLKYYYSNEYHLALKELNYTIEQLPNLAAAYARRGSIYYKLADTDRATINWNYALQLDPEYSEVKDILLNIKNGEKKLNSKLPE